MANNDFSINFNMLSLLVFLSIIHVNVGGMMLHQWEQILIEDILISANNRLKHDPNMDIEASVYADCFYHNTKLAMNIEKSKQASTDIAVMIGAKDKSSTLKSLAYMWTSNKNFLDEIRDSNAFGCAVNRKCEKKKRDIISCVFNKPRLQTSPKPLFQTTENHNPHPSIPANTSKLYALTPDMFRDILSQLSNIHPDIQYDSEYFMDHASASYWKCPFPYAQSPHYEVGYGRVDKTKEDYFGVVLELGIRVPYDDIKMREAAKNFARSWRNIQFTKNVPTKFGCSVDPECHGDMILLCAFYPIDRLNWSKISKQDLHVT